MTCKCEITSSFLKAQSRVTKQWQKDQIYYNQSGELENENFIFSIMPITSHQTHKISATNKNRYITNVDKIKKKVDKDEGVAAVSLHQKVTHTLNQIESAPFTFYGQQELPQVNIHQAQQTIECQISNSTSRIT